MDDVNLSRLELARIVLRESETGGRTKTASDSPAAGRVKDGPISPFFSRSGNQ
jgi:hypothetical protein